ncbi:ANTAR domain-containing protein [Actinoplanes sp. NPDC049265]|uniref:ANTAR domain-containing protein n=1 Tax=Actinoplanes sp. NPDC049265 TaxID=3363902 RepID=UPI0037130B43
MPAPRRSAERAGQRSTPPAAAASAPNQTRRTARPRHPGQGAGAPNAGPVHHTETDHVIPAHPNAPAVGAALPAPRDAADLTVVVPAQEIVLPSAPEVVPAPELLLPAAPDVVIPSEVVRPGGPGALAVPDTGAVEVAGLLHELSARLLSADNVAEALDRLAVFTAGAVPGAVRCSVALITEGQGTSLTASGSDGRGVDDCQFETGEGPGLEAARTRALVLTQDLPNDPRWPALADCARDEDVHAVAAIPLDVQRTSVGALSLYIRRPQGIVPDMLLTAMAIVNQAELLLGEIARRDALSEGATVDRAIGVIIAQRGCGVREAYDVLQETAQRLGMDRQAVAERLIAAAARARDPR